MDVAYRSSASFFPAVGRYDAESLLGPEEAGVFLLRRSSKPGCLVISLRQSERTVHLLVVRRGQGWGLDPSAWKRHQVGLETFPSVDVLVSRLRQLGMLRSGLRNDAAAGDAGAAAAAGYQVSPAAAAAASEQRSVAENREHEYKGMLQVLLGGDPGSVGPRELSRLAQWRERNHFTDEQHARVLAALGLTVERFDTIARDASESRELPEEAACVICLDAPKEAVFVSCGHLATCVDCAPKVNECPVCRATVTEYIRVFT